MSSLNGCALLALPSEVRNEIWQYSLSSEVPLRRLRSFRAYGSRPESSIQKETRGYEPAGLVGTCQQIESETGSLFYKLNDFGLYFSYYIDIAEFGDPDSVKKTIPSLNEWSSMTQDAKCAVLGVPSRYLTSLRTITIDLSNFAEWKMLANSNSSQTGFVQVADMILWLREHAIFLSGITVRFSWSGFDPANFPRALELNTFYRRQKRAFKALKGLRFLKRLSFSFFAFKMSLGAWPLWLETMNINMNQAESDVLLLRMQATSFPNIEKVTYGEARIAINFDGSGKTELCSTWTLWLKPKSRERGIARYINDKLPLNPGIVEYYTHRYPDCCEHTSCRECFGIRVSRIRDKTTQEREAIYGSPAWTSFSPVFGDTKCRVSSEQAIQQPANIFEIGKLPLKIRRIIWKYVLTSLVPLRRCDEFHCYDGISNLLAVSKPILEECSPIFYQENSFMITRQKRSPFDINHLDLTMDQRLQRMYDEQIPRYLGNGIMAHPENLRNVILYVDDPRRIYAFYPCVQTLHGIATGMENLQVRFNQWYDDFPTAINGAPYVHIKGPYDVLRTIVPLMPMFEAAAQIHSLKTVDFVICGIDQSYNPLRQNPWPHRLRFRSSLRESPAEQLEWLEQILIFKQHPRKVTAAKWQIWVSAETSMVLGLRCSINLGPPPVAVTHR